ncbi:MAG: HEAT repeat domain-containing protein [Deltaproteobacteria bacterium]|nr:HEAT repeat domain-containing protein [Deltaproteobacteria bacterium]
MNASSLRCLSSLMVSAILWLGPTRCLADATKTSPSPVFQLTDGRLTAHLTDVSLSTVLTLLARASHTKLVLRGSIEESISVSFTDLPLEEGLIRLLRGKSFTLIYAASATSLQNAGAPDALSAIHLLPAGHGATVNETVLFPPDAEITADDDWAADPVATLVEKSVTATRPHARQQAVVALGDTWRADAVQPLGQVLVADESDTVREAAARALGDTWTSEAVEPLGQALLGDASALVRARAAQALGETWNAEAIGPLRDAVQNDPDDQVRQEAAQALRELGDDLDAPN